MRQSRLAIASSAPILAVSAHCWQLRVSAEGKPATRSKGRAAAHPMQLTVAKADMTAVDVTKKFKHPHHFIYRALLDPKSDKIQRYDIFTSLDSKEVEIAFRVGQGVQSHKGIAHGGCVASVLDDGFGCLFYACCGGTPGFTAHLDVDYRAPVPIDTDLVFRAKVLSEEGRKVWLQGQIIRVHDGAGEDQPVEQVLTEGKALFVRVKKSEASRDSAPSAGALVHARQ